MATKGGKIPAIPAETRTAMAEMRAAGKTIKEIADFYHVSQNSVLKYTVGVLDTPDPSSDGLNTDVEDLVADQHAKRVLSQSKKIDADTVHAGEALREYFKSKGLDVDLRKLPFDQLIKLVKSPGVYEGMNSNVKDVFNEWLMERVNKTEAVNEKQDGKININDLKEMMIIRAFEKMMSSDGGTPKDDTMIADLKAENEKLRQDFRVEMERNRQEMKDLVMEKRLQVMDETNAKTVSSLSGQLNDLILKIESIKYDLPVSGLPAQKTALEELTDAVSQINNVKSSLTALGVIPAAPGSPGATDIYKKPDGSLDFVRYAGDKIESSIKMITGTMSKSAPDKKSVQDTPAPQKQFSIEEAEEFYQQLFQKSSLTSAETDWVNNYTPIRAQYFAPVEEPDKPVGTVEEPASLSDLSEYSSPDFLHREPVQPYSEILDKPTVPADLVEPADLVDPVEPIKPVEPTDEPKKSMIDRLKEKDKSTTQSLADLGF